MKPSEVRPDVELRDMLTDVISTDVDVIPVFADGDRYVNPVPEDFIDITFNGDPQSMTRDMFFMRGNLALSLFTRLFPDGSIRSSRVQKLLEQIESRVNGVVSANYFYRMDMRFPIVPTTANESAGYSQTTLNVEWQTTNKISNNS